MREVMLDNTFLKGMAEFWRPLEEFVEHLRAQVSVRWEFWATNHEQRQVHEVVGGLLARQATLASQLAMNPLAWNEHSAPLFLRPMVENCITIAWILKDPDERARQFIEYGLGQENLLLEHAKANLRAEGKDPEDDLSIAQWKEWISSLKYPFLTEVNVGNWADSNTGKMAEEVGRLELHRQDYARWSGGTHNMWQHIVRWNLRDCRNPLHGAHRLPTVSSPTVPDTGLLRQAAEYVDMANHVFDEATGFESNTATALDELDRFLTQIRWPEEEADGGKPSTS